MSLCGRYVRIEVSLLGLWVPLSGSRSDAISFENEQVDITTKDDLPWRLLAVCGVRGVNLRASGAVTSGPVMDELVNHIQENNSKTYRIIDQTGEIIRADFHMSVLSRSGAYNGEELWEIELMSNGVIIVATEDAILDNRGTPIETNRGEPLLTNRAP